MSTVTWIEDGPGYVKEFVQELELLGHTVTIIRNANALMGRLNKVVATSSIIVLDLWIPPGVGNMVPKDLGNTDRGIFLFEELQAKRKELGSKVDLVVLSGNLDNDTINRFLELGVKKNDLWKKPVGEEFFARLEQRLDKEGEETRE